MRSRGGFQLPTIRSTAAKLAIALVAGSVIAQLLYRSTGFSLFLTPGEVLGKLHLWQPFTFLVVENDALGVIFGAIIVWSMGTTLEMGWGSRRLLRFALGVPFAAGLITLGLSLVIPSLRGVPYTGGWAMAASLWVAYGLSIGGGQANFWGLPVSGNVLALIGAGFVLLNGLFNPWQFVFCTLVALVITFAYVRLGWTMPRHVWLRFQSWRLQRQLKGRAKHLKLISKDRNTPSDSDRYLH